MDKNNRLWYPIFRWEADMKNFLNLTPHDVTVFLENGEKIVFKRSGRVARINVFHFDAGHIIVDGKKIPLTYVEYGEVEGLPEYDPSLFIIVSQMVAQALQGSKWSGHILVPDTSPQNVVRDEKGRILGVKGFQLW